MFRLALALGEKRPRSLLQSLTSREWAEWLAYWSLEPWGEERADFRSGIATAAIKNCWRGKGERAARAHDFMPFTEDVEQTPEQIKQQMTEVLRHAASRKA